MKTRQLHRKRKQGMRQKRVVKKLVSFFMVCLLFLVGTAKNDTAYAAEITSGISISSFELVSSRTDGTFKNGDKVSLNIGWDASSYGTGLHEGDYFVIQLPSEMEFAGYTVTNFALTDTNGTVVANGVLDTGSKTITSTFTSAVEGRYDVKGTISVSAKITISDGAMGDTTTFQVSTGASVLPIEVPVKPASGWNPIEEEVFLWKSGSRVTWNSESTADNITQASWGVRIVNNDGATYNNVVITDSLSGDGGTETDEEYLTDTFKVYTCTYGGTHGQTAENRVLVSSSEYSLTFSDDKKSFTLNLGTISGSYLVEYYTTFDNASGKTLNNSVTFTSTEKNSTTGSYMTAVGASGTAETTIANRIKIEKVDAEDNAILLEGAEFEVTNSSGETFTLTTDSDGTALSEILKQGTYTVKETKAPTGYVLDETEYEVTVGDEGVELTLENQKEKTSISVEKKWNGKEGQSATVHLLANGTEVDSVTLTSEDDWKHTFSDVDKYSNGEEIEYTIVEDEMEGYASKVTGNAQDGFVVTNTSTTRDVKVTKQWNGTSTDSVTIHLLADGQEVASTVLNADNNWTYTFENVDKDADYTITEDKIEGYTSTVTGNAEDGFVVTNTQNEVLSDTIDIPVQKKWVGKTGSEAVIHVFANGTKVKEVTLTENNNWKYTFEDLPKYDENGLEIDYSIKEVAQAGYTTKIKETKDGGYVVTNTRNGIIPTGLENNLGLYIGGAFLSLVGIFFVLKLRRA